MGRPVCPVAVLHKSRARTRRGRRLSLQGIVLTPTVAGSEISQEVQLVAQQAGSAVALNGRYEFDLLFRG